LKRNSWKTKKLNSRATEQANLLTDALQLSFLVSAVLKRFSDSFASLKVRKIDEAANFVFVQLIDQEPGIYDKFHPDDTRRDKIGLAWERISHEMNETAPW
jgi:hypothetical protein